MERIDGLLEEFRDVRAGIRPRMEAADLNRDYSDVVARLRYDPDAIPLSAYPQEALDEAARAIMARITWRKVDPPVS